MGLLYKAFNHICMEGLEWGVEKGKELNKEKRIVEWEKQDLAKKERLKSYDNKEFYSKFDGNG